MKMHVKQILLSGLLIFLFTICRAQAGNEPSPRVPSWISQIGYWVIKSNLDTPDSSTVFFYRNDGVLVYEEPVSGKCINIKKRRTLKLLKSVLDKSVMTWNGQNQAPVNRGYLASLGK